MQPSDTVDQLHSIVQELEGMQPSSGSGDATLGYIHVSPSLWAMARAACSKVILL